MQKLKSSTQPEECAPVIFAPFPAGATDRIMEAIERLKKVPTGIRFTDASGETMIDHKVEQAIKADPTGISAALMTVARAGEASEDITFTATEVLAMKPEDLELLRNLKAIRDLTAEPEINAPITAFQDAIRAAARQYGLLSKKVEETIADRAKLAYIRTSALYCIENFEVHQFNQGEKSDQPFNYNRFVHEFNNINSAIRISATQPVNGVTMALIRDPEIPEFSYFVFILRAGDNITVLTDRPEFDNPHQKYLRRNPGRDLESRLNSNFFPYGVLDIKVDEKGKAYIPKDVSAGRLVIYQTEAIQLCRLDQIEPDETVWTLLMFDLIAQRYYRENRHTEQLSYTAEMLRTPLALHSGTQLSLRNYKTLDVPDLTLAEIDTGATRESFDCKPTEFNRWMEERYGPQVNPEIFKILTEPKLEKLLLGHTSTGKALTPFTGYEPPTFRGDKKEAVYPVSHLPAENFGTRKQILKDYKWIGRSNLAKALQALADEEYKREKDNVLAWYRAQVRTNAPALRRAILAGSLKAPGIKYESGFNIRPHKLREQEILTIVPEGKGRWEKLGYASTDCVHHGGWSQMDESYYCIEEPNALCSCYAMFQPTSPQGIALLTGREVSELPIWLQHWYGDEPYSGNMILSDVDPMEWQLQNPWMGHRGRRGGFPTTVIIAFCRKTLKRWEAGKGISLPFPKEAEIEGWVKGLRAGDYIRSKRSLKRWKILDVRENETIYVRDPITWRRKFLSREDISRRFQQA